MRALLILVIMLTAFISNAMAPDKWVEMKLKENKKWKIKKALKHIPADNTFADRWEVSFSLDDKGSALSVEFRGNRKNKYVNIWRAELHVSGDKLKKARGAERVKLLKKYMEWFYFQLEHEKKKAKPKKSFDNFKALEWKPVPGYEYWQFKGESVILFESL